jgi:hypothetical protein
MKTDKTNNAKTTNTPTKPHTASNDPWQCGAVSAGVGPPLSVDAVLRSVTNHSSLREPNSIVIERQQRLDSAAAAIGATRRDLPSRAASSHRSIDHSRPQVRVCLDAVLKFDFFHYLFLACS